MEKWDEGAVAILNKLVRVDFIKKVTSEQKLEGVTGMSSGDI